VLLFGCTDARFEPVLGFRGRNPHGPQCKVGQEGIEDGVLVKLMVGDRKRLGTRSKTTECFAAS
jgi:hypothetical protein